nr:amino acid adenylation domain-containing protein [Kibdelosporangium phytohabitans]
MAGPVEPLPGPLFVELFEDQVRARPDDLAATHNGRQWSYGELNARANRIAHALLRNGLTAEEPVAVVMERNLDWIAALLGVFKAGGVYLPVRPDFPVDRVATQLRGAACRFGVTESASARTLEGAIDELGADGFVVLPVEAEAGSAHVTNPGTPIFPDQLAYIYFTSGSTGAPKGAMCEHAGMLNHQFIKITDTELVPGDVVTQTASQCFDISLWQVVAPLLVGGSTLIVDTAAQLDVAGFIGMLAAGGVDVIQVVPSFLDVMVSHLARNPSSLGDVRMVSVTGEALKIDLVRRWFAVMPDIKLINAYGATEVHDDTMHEVLHGVPATDFVSVGRPQRNVRTYVLDESFRLAPLGTPGEIAFAGVSVGRGYINDEERTALAFTEDPYHPGDRVYRTGDFGRWLPDGTIEFLGRRDEQVKIRGYRVEIGEIENKLLRMPEVDECAVIVVGTADDTKTLVAWYTTSATVLAEQLRDFLGALLPEYMVPTSFHRLPSLPLTENGKVDKKSLTRMAAAAGQGAVVYAAPVSDVERQLAAAWAEVLNVPLERIGRDDEFFDLGGTSLAAVRLIVQLDRVISLKQLMARPALAELAQSISGDDRGQARGLVHNLSTVDDAVATVVCFPYAGGNAVNFQGLGKELEGHGIAVKAVELPGHDIGRDDESFKDVPAVAVAALAEIEATVSGPLLLWGHEAGVAPALEVARLLEADGRPPLAVFAGAAAVSRLRDTAAEIDALSDEELVTRLREDTSFTGTETWQPERASLVGAAYRHDLLSAVRYLDGPGLVLSTPVHVVLAADDHDAAGHEWTALATRVDTHEVPGGGRYFVRTRPADAAAAVMAAVRPVAAPRG